MAKGQSYTIRSVERAIAVLRCFTLAKPELGVLEVSRELDLHKSTVSRLMRTLELGGVLDRNPETDRYRLGLDLIGLASKVITYLDVRDVSRPFLRDLSEGCQETVTLSVMEDGQVINLEQMVPHLRRLKNIGQVGLRAPPHCAAAGKALMAYMDKEQIDQILTCELERFTSNTITDPHELRRVLAQVREQGFAIANEELEEGLNVVAAPIHEHDGRVTATVCIAGPASRVTPERFPHLAIQAKDTAAKISARLGYKS